MKRKFNIFDLFISIVFCLFLSFFILPFGIKYFLSDNQQIPNDIKEEILHAGKKYLDNNNDINIVSLNELYKSGYLIKNRQIDDLNCFNNITTVRKENNVYYLNIECSIESTTLSLLEKK